MARRQEQVTDAARYISSSYATKCYLLRLFIHSGKPPKSVCKDLMYILNFADNRFGRVCSMVAKHMQLLVVIIVSISDNERIV